MFQKLSDLDKFRFAELTHGFVLLNSHRVLHWVDLPRAMNKILQKSKSA